MDSTINDICAYNVNVTNIIRRLPSNYLLQHDFLAIPEILGTQFNDTSIDTYFNINSTYDIPGHLSNCISHTYICIHNIYTQLNNCEISYLGGSLKFTNKNPEIFLFKYQETSTM